MPRRLFAEDARKLDVSVASAVKLGAVDAYDVSVMAATWRIVQLTREPAAMVVTVDGRVDLDLQVRCVPPGTGGPLEAFGMR